MLTLMTPGELERRMDWAWRLTHDLTRSGYPTYMDGIKTREDFVRAAEEGMAGNDEELLLFRTEGEVCGWIQWYWLPEDRYAATSVFLTSAHTDAALAEFTAYAARKLPGYALHMGFPANNADAVQWLDKHDFRLLEASVNHTMFFDRYASREVSPDVRLMKRAEDEALFRALHTDTDLYWTAERILAARERWRVYLYRREAALYAQVSPGGWPEIFGLAGSDAPEACEALMTACLNDCKAAGCAWMSYFEEDERRLPVLARLGFEVVSRYVCYQKIL